MRVLHRVTTLFRPWVLVGIGIVFNIFSAVITSHYIDVNNQEIHRIEDETSAIDVRINSYWQNRQVIERKRESFLLLLELREMMKTEGKGSKKAFVDSYVRDFVNELIADYGLDRQALDSDRTVSAQDLVEVTGLAMQKIISEIDDIYLGKILLDKERQPIEDRKSRLMSLALFLQLIGLILVLARDLQR